MRHDELLELRRAPLPGKLLMRNSLLEVTPVIPGSLSRLTELAGNLFFSWHRPTRALFEDLDPELWKQTHGKFTPDASLREPEHAGALRRR